MRVLLCGSFHGKNKGDEAIAEAEIEYIRAHFPESQITVATKDPRYFSTHYAVSAVSVMRPIQMLRALHRSTHVIIGGGGLFFEPHAFHAFNIIRNQSYVWPMLCAYARFIGKRVAFVGVGVESMRLGFSEFIMRAGMNRAHAILVRDEASADYLRDIGIKAPIRVTADSAFLLHAELQEKKPENILRIGVSLHYGISILQTPDAVDRWVWELAQSLLLFAGRSSQTIEWINAPMHPKDATIAERVLSILRKSGQQTSEVSFVDRKPSEVVSFLSSLDMHLGMRMHGAILSTIAHTPCVVLSYARKVDQYIELLSRYNPHVAPHAVVPYTEVGKIEKSLAYVQARLDDARIMQRRCVAEESDRAARELLQALS